MTSALRQRLALGGYTAALALLMPLYFLRLWWRGRREALYRQYWTERIGRYDDAASNGWVWLHAVSLGETRAAAPLVAALRARLPGMRLLLTHGTATGREAGKALLQPGDRQRWLPSDLPGACRRFLEHHRPGIGVLMETEIWPNLLHQASALGVPMVLANARLSAKSHRQGERFAVLLRPALRRLDLVLAQTEADAERLVSSEARQVTVCGNLKFDMAPDERLLGMGRAWRLLLARPVVLAAVTREGEEAMLLQAWLKRAARGTSRALLLVVPRHPQRFDEVEGLLRQAGLQVARRSAWPSGEPDREALQADAWLGDSMGEMPLYYAMSDVGLLGGSFAPLGGQNLIEAAACGCPIMMGPHTFNFDEAARLAEEAGAAVRVRDMNDAVETALGLLAQPDRRGDLAAHAERFAARHRGAAERMAAAIAQRVSGVSARTADSC
jgi:3-deoxy-D-manno-octulosonic-acid transferase